MAQTWPFRAACCLRDREGGLEEARNFAAEEGTHVTLALKGRLSEPLVSHQGVQDRPAQQGRGLGWGGTSPE